VNSNIDNRQPPGGPGAGRWRPSFKDQSLLPDDAFTAENPIEVSLSSTKETLDDRCEIYSLNYIESQDGFEVKGVILSQYYCPYCGRDLDYELAQELILQNDLHDLTCMRCWSNVDAISTREYHLALSASPSEVTTCITQVGSELIRDRDRGTTNRDDGSVQERVRSRLSHTLQMIEENPNIAMYIPMMWLGANGDFDSSRDPRGVTILLDPNSPDITLLVSQTDRGQDDETAWADSPVPTSALRVLAKRLDETNASYLQKDELDLLRKRLEISVAWRDLRSQEQELDAR